MLLQYLDTLMMMLFHKMRRVYCVDNNYDNFLRRRFFLCPDWLHCKKLSWGVSSVGAWLQYGHLCLVSNYIFPVGNLWWMNLRDVLCSAWRILFMMFCWGFQSIEFIVIVDHLYFFHYKVSCFVCMRLLSYVMIYVVMYVFFTYTVKGIEVIWVLMEMMAECVAM